MNRTLFIVALFTWSCTSGQTEPPAKSEPVAEKKTPAAPRAAAPEKKPPANAAKTTATRKKTPSKGKSGRPPIKWQDDLTWLSWADARAKSAAEGKSICLVVYADWCPRCRELAPLFADPEVAKLAKGLIRVRQDQDARPDWLLRCRRPPVPY